MVLFGPPNIDILKAKKNTGGLIKALRYNKDREIRKAAAQALDELNWSPGCDETGAWYWVAKENWEEVYKTRGSALKPLILALEEEDQHDAAAVGLIKIGRPAIIPLFRCLFERNETLQNAASNVLFQIGQPAMSYLAYEVTTFLNHGNEKGADILINVLTKFGDPAVQLFINSLGSSATMKGSIYALGKIGDPRAVEPLIEVLKTNIYSDDLDYILVSLSEIGNARAVESLISVCKQVLIDKKNTDPTKDFMGGQNHVYSMTYGSISRALSNRTFKPSAVETLIAALKDELPEIRAAAADALGNIGDPRATEPLTAVAEDDSEIGYVRKAATISLKKITNKHVN